MPSTQIIFIISTVIFLSIGQILFKIAAVDFPNGGVFNMKLISAVLVYFFATTLWFLVLRITPLKLAYPFVGLAFILVPIFSYTFLNEDLNFNNILGAVIIGLGIWVSVTNR